MIQFKIEKKVPFGFVQQLKYPWDKMEVGDSFKYPVSLANRIQSSAYGWSKVHNTKFKSRNSKTIGRIWRVK